MFHVIGAHPSFFGRQGQRRIQTIQMESQRAIIAWDQGIGAATPTKTRAIFGILTNFPVEIARKT
uniref:Uncharacterized protein n=1 Tax=Romanomermis culicivorax TaxID=13658 RepID=A0A915KDK1_ROMCU